ncbi:ABC transporter substrate-binding protein [Natrarchaeobius sp. A-rgal3]|uniref:ABC transporter substrate-binding protein n=1 Tax=Natrarchaeobius versutus TaxID=1679078 RepID=UPI00350F07A1
MARNVSRRRVLGGIGAGTGIALAGCLDGNGNGNGGNGNGGNGNGGNGGNGGSDDADVMVGTLLPVTGDLGSLGAPIRDAAILPGSQLEDEGVAYEIDIREEDTETDPQAGISGAQALADAGYPSVTGAASSAVTIAVAEDIFFPNEVVGISPASTSPDITGMDGDYLLRTAPSDAWQGDAMAEIAYEQEGAETMSTFFLNNDYGQGLQDTIVDSFEDLGGEVLEEVAFEPEQPSYDSELQSALADDPDLMVVIGYPDSGEQIFRDYYINFDNDHTIMVPDGLQDHALPGNVDNPMSNVIGTAPSARGPEAETFNEMYEDEYGDSPGVFTGQAYDATAIHILAQLRADDLSGPAVSAEIREVANPDGEEIGPSNLADGLDMAANGEEIQYQGASSVTNFDDNGDMEAVTYDLFEFDEDGYHITDTIEFES